MKREDDFRLYRRKLPHWRMEGAAYFVTWRVGEGHTDLTPAERTIVADALLHFDSVRYRLAGFVVMNDHVHVIVEPADGHRLEGIVQSWKSFTAHRLVTEGSRTGIIWQREYFDRLLRSEMEMTEKLQYICDNPCKRWPEMADYPWLWMAK